ncbi:N-formylglutamate amidohydrolase [Leptothoe kymatousa]|uniref:N-formylglutamate amidohydrolase n=1 Tax=Leptothoe kymatousa TAU-MAC 1615 TaxID=2364775 RepID=A0ABS5Y0D2_9CYAN|nr:N-formylglutamate amidohydrolase [Leptothoe kymatousa]MBT9311273.1 N-formylglutamate amidohydrolase [Leptothoe kymatousa TAU-MAC 1615]
MFDASPFRVHPPTGRPCPIVASIPHSGLTVPTEMMELLHGQYQDFLPHQDWHLNRLYDFLPSLGITVLEAAYSRYVVDLNRVAKAPFFGSFWQAAVPRQTAFGSALYRVVPDQPQIQRRIDAIYRPYHQRLETLLQAAIAQFGQVYLLDLHSFAGPITDQVCLGNNNGRSCSNQWMTAVKAGFNGQDYQVACNHVFNGGYITRHYGAMANVDALQIEFRYHNYLDLKQLDQPRIPDWDVPEFHQAQQRVAEIFRSLVDNLSLSCQH